MVNTSARPISVDGVRLDTLAWNVEKVTRGTAARRSGDYEVPNMDGAIPSLNDGLEPAIFGLDMWLRGTDADGVVPTAGGLTTMRNNLDELLHLFGKRHALLEVTEVVDQAASANAALNPGFEVDTANWAVGASYWTNAGATLTRITSDADTGVASGEVVTSGAAQLEGATTIVPGIPAGTLVTITVRLKRVSGSQNLQLRVRDTTNGINATDALVTTSGAFVTATTTITTGAAAASLLIGTTNAGTAGAVTFRVDSLAVTYQASTSRRCLAKVTDTISPELNLPGTTGRFSVALTIPSGQWEDAAVNDWNQAAIPNGTITEVTALAGATERINDGEFAVCGPVTNPRITDPTTGMWVQYNGTLADSTQRWRIRSDQWVARVGTGIWIGTADTVGTDVTGLVSVGGPSRPYMLPLTAARQSGARRVNLTLTGSGFSAATTLAVRARRKYAA